MLAARRRIARNGKKFINSPLLVPSFSSKGFDQVKKIITTAEECITDCALVSAYDIHHKLIETPIHFPEVIFIDSGGYECGKDIEFSDLGYTVHEPKEWNPDLHSSVLDAWPQTVPAVLVSYDHPNERLKVEDQIARAQALFHGREHIARELLVKPETGMQSYIQINNVIKNIHALAGFEVIGFTEKELGNSVLKRMIAIAKIRAALHESGIDIPIHIFGSLDTISTPLYFLAGADIFDGLTWLRFAFMDGFTTYIHNFAALHLGVKTKDGLASAQVLFRNYYYMKDLELQMHAYLNAREFKSFSHHSEFFEKTFQAMQSELKED